MLKKLKMLGSKKLCHWREYKNFQELYEELSKRYVSIDYLRNSSIVRCFFNHTNEPVAGYVINSSKDNQVQQSEANLKKDKRKFKDISEISCLWMKSKKVPLGGKIFFYMTMVREASKNGKTFMLGK